MEKIAFRLHATPGHQSVSDAHGCCFIELSLDVEVIITLQKRICNDVIHILLMLLPVIIYQLGGCVLHLTNEAFFGCHLIVSFQHFRNDRDVSILHRPKIYRPGMFTPLGVGYIKHIAKSGIIPAGVNQGNTVGASTDVPTHFLIPEIEFSTGCSVRPLSMNHDLFVIWVLV